MAETDTMLKGVKAPPEIFSIDAEVQALRRQKLTCGTRIGKFFQYHWKGVVVLLLPILFSPLLFIETQYVKEYRCLYILLVMSFFWLTEVLPLPVTSMIPIVAFPVAGIMSSEATCALYFKDTLVMFIGGIMMALAVEHCNLHKRLALRVIQIVGCSPRRLHFGLVIVTMFISLWINNAAATAMMCPIIQAVLEQLEAQGMCKLHRDDVKKSDDEPPYPSKITMCFYMGTAYAATMGGCGTIIGTATNLTFKGIYDGKFPNAKDSIDFATFMFYSVPPMLIYTFLMYLYMQWAYMGLFRPNSKEAKEVNLGDAGAQVARKVIDEKYEQLGPMSCHEFSVMIAFILMILLYFTRHPGIFTGWDSLFESEIKNASPTLLVVILCFILPANYAFLKWCSKSTDVPNKTINSLHSWKFIQQKVPWGLIFLLGGGFALAKGTEVSKLDKLLGQGLKGLKGLHPLVLLLVVILFAEFATEFSSNVAMCNIIVPVLIEMCLAIEIHPLYLVLPAGLACSMAFHLPVATPPNAIVASFANIRTKDMIICGIGPSLITIVVLFISCQTWGLVIYPNLMDGLPDWIERVNQTIAQTALANNTLHL
ncbi:protein I'm not dead yet [Condylostylus longicornis]|uniref:protein I'm not dead yet n=1 Tax=Condylostylus longicornis TaxID=2530218 RepID=UPI00244DBC3B|nr:protein I'm not dead yet [Condylostylus longicornis]